MSYSSDYLKRMIEQLGEFLLAIKRLAEGEHYAEALEQIDAAFKETLGMDSKFVNEAPVDYLVLMTSVGRVGDVDKTMVLADLLNAEAEVYEMRGDYEQSDRRYQVALEVLATVASRLSHKPTDEHIERIDQFVSKLSEDESSAGIPFESKASLFQIYERVGRFDQAENILYEMLGEVVADDEPTVGASGIAFYERLLKLSDYELETGGLPRTEVQESLRELTE